MADTDVQIDDLEVEIYNDGFRDGYDQALSEMPETVELTCESFCDWLKKIKEKNGYTYEYMSNRTGMSEFALQRYITRHLPPSLDSVVRIVKAFGGRIEIR